MTTIPSVAQWRKSAFFNDKRKTEYKIDLHFNENISLPPQDVDHFISILAAHHWEQNADKSKVGLEMNEISWGRYHFYIKQYDLTITHPDKRKIEIRIDAQGLRKDVFGICSSTGKLQQAIRMHEDYNNKLTENEIEDIMQIFWRNVTDFGNVSYTPGQKVKISSAYSFANVFQGLPLPDIELNDEDSEKLARLYNKGWNIAADFFPGGIPTPTVDLFNNFKCIYFDDIPYSYNNPLFRFSKKDQLAIRQIIENAIKGHNGIKETELQKSDSTEKQIIRYQYKDGLLQGDMEILNIENKLIYRLTYDKDIPIRYIKYRMDGQAETEVLFFPADRLLEWIEYDEKGQVIHSGKNHYLLTYPMWDIDLFYKYTR